MHPVIILSVRTKIRSCEVERFLPRQNVYRVQGTPLTAEKLLYYLLQVFNCRSKCNNHTTSPPIWKVRSAQIKWRSVFTSHSHSCRYLVSFQNMYKEGKDWPFACFCSTYLHKLLEKRMETVTKTRWCRRGVGGLLHFKSFSSDIGIISVPKSTSLVLIKKK
jgi:hypothetical protein